MSSFGNNTFLGKELGPITVGQLIGIVVSFVIGIALLCADDVGGSLFAWVVVAIILYMVPHVLGAKPKTKAVYGAVFIILALVIGAFGLGPGYIDEKSKTDFNESNAFFDKVTYTANGNVVTVEVHFDGTQHTDEVPAVSYAQVDRIPFKSTLVSKVTDKMDYAPLNIVSGTGTTDAVATADFTIDNSKLYFMFVSMISVDGDSHSVDGSTKSGTTLSGWDFTGDKTTYTIGGCAYALMFIGVVFYLVLIFTTMMRMKFASTRKKMEDQGRLYPQGYGRCSFCGAIVLPGEVTCRKCGAYIDRPESMKPHKKDCFTCSACGAEVTANMTECPKCGAKFDGEESEITHVDGTTDISSDMMVCPVCGKHTPANSERCVHCGKNFKE